MPGDHRVNDRIRVDTVRLIDQDGNQLGVMPTRDALALAKSLDLDLVEDVYKRQPSAQSFAATPGTTNLSRASARAASRTYNSRRGCP